MRIYPFCDKKTLDEVMPVSERGQKKGIQNRNMVPFSEQGQKKGSQIPKVVPFSEQGQEKGNQNRKVYLVS
jgi:hypothetical protein